MLNFDGGFPRQGPGTLTLDEQRVRAESDQLLVASLFVQSVRYGPLLVVGDYPLYKPFSLPAAWLQTGVGPAINSSDGRYLRQILQSNSLLRLSDYRRFPRAFHLCTLVRGQRGLL